MCLGRDSQFSVLFWLGVAFVVCEASHLPGDIGVCVLHSDGFITSGYACFPQSRFVSSYFSLALRRKSVPTDVVCTRRFRSGGAPLPYVEGVDSDLYLGAIESGKSVWKEDTVSL